MSAMSQTKVCEMGQCLHCAGTAASCTCGCHPKRAERCPLTPMHDGECQPEALPPADPDRLARIAHEMERAHFRGLLPWDEIAPAAQDFTRKMVAAIVEAADRRLVGDADRCARCEEMCSPDDHVEAVHYVNGEWRALKILCTECFDGIRPDRGLPRRSDVGEFIYNLLRSERMLSRAEDEWEHLSAAGRAEWSAIGHLIVRELRLIARADVETELRQMAANPPTVDELRAGAEEGLDNVAEAKRQDRQMPPDPDAMAMKLEMSRSEIGKLREALTCDHSTAMYGDRCNVCAGKGLVNAEKVAGLALNVLLRLDEAYEALQGDVPGGGEWTAEKIVHELCVAFDPSRARRL
jgi:hypothetical protein